MKNIREEYAIQKSDLRESLRNAEVNLEAKKRDYMGLKEEFDLKISQLKKDMDQMEHQMV